MQTGANALPNGPEKRRALARYRYGLTEQEFDALLARAAGRCEICDTEVGEYGIPSDKPRPHIDHCADTNAVRGVLCGPCNTAIGLLRHDPKILQAAEKYLQMEAEFVKKDLRTTKTHCKNGHEFNEANIYTASDGRRRCRICRNARSAMWNRERSAKREDCSDK